MIKKEIILLVIFLSVFGFLSGDILKDIQNKKTEKIMKNIESGKLDFNKAIDGHYPFLWAIMGDNHQLVRFMLDKGADLGVKTKGAGETALHIAAKKRNHKLIKALLEKGMAPNQQDRNGYTPLLTLCEMRTRGQDFVLAIMDTYYRTAEISKENLQLIIQNLGLQEESFDGNAYEQLLGLANPSAYLLLKHGADPNLGTQYRKPIIQARTKGQNPLLVLLLIEKGADLNDSLAQAYAMNQTALALKLIENGAKAPNLRYCIAKLDGLTKAQIQLIADYRKMHDISIKNKDYDNSDLTYSFDKMLDRLFSPLALNEDETAEIILALLDLFPKEIVTDQTFQPLFDIFQHAHFHRENAQRSHILFNLLHKALDKGFDPNQDYQGQDRRFLYGHHPSAYNGWTQAELDLFRGRYTANGQIKMTVLELAIRNGNPVALEMLLPKFNKDPKLHETMLFWANKGIGDKKGLNGDETMACQNLLKKIKK